MKRFLFVIALFSSSVFSQYDSFYGFTGGLSFSFGNKLNRLGIHFSGYYNYAIAQANAQLNMYYDFQSMGLKQKTPEIQLGGGLEFGFGRKDSLRNKFIGLTESNMEHVYSLGYSYIRYWDKQKTSQSSGIFTFNFTDFKVAFENDLFGGGQGWRDRFRTGGILFEYQYMDAKFAFVSTLWTGDYSRCGKVKDSNYPARYGYLDQKKAEFGDKSAGLMSVQVSYFYPLGPLGQMPRANLGIDSERVRNFFQNKLVHDLNFLPDKWIKHKPYHLPMLQDDGSQYLYIDGQKVKRSSIYFNLGMNNMPFY